MTKRKQVFYIAFGVFWLIVAAHRLHHGRGLRGAVPLVFAVASFTMAFIKDDPPK